MIQSAPYRPVGSKPRALSLIRQRDEQAQKAQWSTWTKHCTFIFVYLNSNGESVFSNKDEGSRPS